MAGCKNQATGHYYYTPEFREELEMEMQMQWDRMLDTCDLCDYVIGSTERSYNIDGITYCPHCYAKKMIRIGKKRKGE